MIFCLAVSLAFNVALVVAIIAWHRVHELDVYGNPPGVTAGMLARGWRKSRRGIVPVLKR